MRDPESPEALPHPEASATSVFDDQVPREELERLSTLQIFDLLQVRLRLGRISPGDLSYLRERLSNLEEQQDQAREALEQMDRLVDGLRAPALRSATCLGPAEDGLVWLALGGADYLCRPDPSLPQEQLEIGARVLCNEAFNVVRVLGSDRTGPVARIESLLPDGRLRLGGASPGGTATVVLRSAGLAKEKLRAGTEVRLDPQQRVAVEVIGTQRPSDPLTERVDPVPWEAIGGQDEAVRAIRDAIELPFLHRSLFETYRHAVPKGFLLHGPPGCGKTLLGKATAFNLRRQIREATGVDRPEFFLHVKGPEVLNMWLGESERQVRELFVRCRQRAEEGQLAFLFIDEAESILGIRRAGPAAGILSTLVPMFCTEMDGIEPLSNVVVILASNRPDLIDPAILRPGRIDRRIRVRRPDRGGAERIYAIHLGGDIPLAEPRESLAQAAAAAHFARIPTTEFLEVLHRSGRREVLHHGDLASGAVIGAVVARAKELAIRRAIASGEPGSLGRADLLQALELEHAGDALFPVSDLTEDWMKLTDMDPQQVVRLGPVRPRGRVTASVV
jgi:proteasome-associated ATPase